MAPELFAHAAASAPRPSAPLRYGAVSLGCAWSRSRRRSHAVSQEDCDVLSVLAFSAAPAMVGSRIETDLAGERLRLSATSTLTGAGQWRWDVLTNDLQWSPEMFELTGLDPRDRRPSMPLWESMLHPEDRRHDDLAAAVADSARTGCSRRCGCATPTAAGASWSPGRGRSSRATWSPASSVRPST